MSDGLARANLLLEQAAASLRQCGGRMGRSAGSAQQVHVLGSLGVDGDLSSWPDAATYTVRNRLWDSADCRADGPGLWRVSTYGQGAFRPPNTRAPLSPSTLVDDYLPAGSGAPTRNAAPLWAELTITRSTCRRYLVDWGANVVVHAESVGIGWVAPPTFTTRLDDFAWVDENVNLELVLYGDIARVEGTDASSGVYPLTQTYYVAADEQRAFMVPRGAVSLQISRDTPGGTNTGWFQLCYGLPGTTSSRTTTSIYFENGQSTLTAIAPAATHLLAPTLPGEEALWTLTWGIEL